MLKHTFKMLTLIISFSVSVSGSDIAEQEAKSGLKNAKSLYNNGFCKMGRMAHLYVIQDKTLSLRLRVSAVEQLSLFNKHAAIECYYYLLHSIPNLSRPAKFIIKAKLHNLVPDLRRYWEIVNNPTSLPLKHFNAACELQSFIYTKDSIVVFTLLQEKIEAINEELNQVLPLLLNVLRLNSIKELESMRHLEKLYGATTAIILELNSLVSSLEP